MEQVNARLREAETHARECRWGDAALAYANAAERAAELEKPAAAVRAWEAAGESWRRDDRPVSAAEALSRALSLVGNRPQGVTVRLKLAGVLGELGRTNEAERLCAEALEVAPKGPLRAVAIDTAFEARLARGRVAEARKLFFELESAGAEEIEMALSFREGQLLRCDGQLAQAAVLFGRVVVTAERHPEAAPARAAAEGELAEVALLRGDVTDAISLFERAKQHFADAGRRALTWRVEAGRVRAAVAAGLEPMVHELDDGITFAQTREMRVLEIDLRIARGVAKASTDPASARWDLDEAIHSAVRLGHCWRAGRARVERARRCSGTAKERLEDLRSAEESLVGSAPWVARAILGQAEVLSRSEPAVARTVAATALARFMAMEMEHDAADARRVLEELVAQ